MKKVLSGILLGGLLAWLFSSTYRTILDHANPIFSLEWWTGLVLFGSAIAVIWGMIQTPQSKKNTKKEELIEILILLLGMLLGASLVLGWVLQMTKHHTEQNISLSQQNAVQSAILLTVLTTEKNCTNSKLFLLSLKDNTDYVPTSFEKYWIKDRVLALHQSKCLSDDDVFEVIKDLRFRPTQEAPPKTALYDYVFFKNTQNTFSLEQELGLNEKQWCFHIKDTKRLCENLSDDILLSSQDYINP